MLAKIHFGAVGKKLPNWRLPKYDHLWEPDDDEDRPCQQDVIDMLGFNPDDEDWEKDEETELEPLT